MEEKINQTFTKLLKKEKLQEKYRKKKLVENEKISNKEYQEANQVILQNSKKALKQIFETKDPDPTTLKEVMKLVKQNAPGMTRTITSAKMVDKIQDSVETENKAKKLNEEGMISIENNNYKDGIAKILKSIQLIDGSKAIDAAIVFRLTAIQSALLYQDIETALTQAVNLDTILVSPLFKNFIASDIGPLLGTRIDKGDLPGIYLIMAECFLYLGDLSKVQNYFEKVTIPQDFQKQQYDLVHIALDFLLPRHQSLRNKIKVAKNLEGLSLVISVVEKELIDLIDNSKLDAAIELLDLFMNVTECFSILSNYNDQSSPIWQGYLKFLNAEMQTKLHIGKKLFDLFKITNDQEMKIKLQQSFLELFTDTLKYAQDNKIQAFIYLSSSFLVEYYSFALVAEQNLDCLDNKIVSDYFKYINIRNLAEKTLAKHEKKNSREKGSIKKVTPTLLEINENKESNKEEKEDTEKKVSFSQWQKDYNTAAAQITTKSREEALERLKILQQKYKTLNQQAQIYYGIAECYHFNCLTFEKVILKIEKIFKDLAVLHDNQKKDLWKLLESDYFAIKENISFICQNLNYAIFNFQLCIEKSTQLVEGNITSNQFENNEFQKMISECETSIIAAQEFNESIQSIVKQFINEMETKKEYLITIGKYGRGSKNSNTSEMVRFSIEQDCLLNQIKQTSKKLLETANDLQKSFSTKSKSLGIWYLQNGDKSLKIFQYEDAYKHYLQAKTEFNKMKKLQLLGTTESKLALVKAIQVDLLTDRAEKRELTLCSIEHSKLAIQAYEQAKGMTDLTPHIEQIKNEILKKEEFLSKLDQISNKEISPS